MRLKCPERILQLSVLPREIHIVRKIFLVFSEKPYAAISIKNPVAPSPRQAELRFKAPSIRPNVDEHHRVILTSRRRDRDTRTDKQFLFPRDEIRHVHSWTTMEINRKAEPRVSEPGSVDLGWDAFNLCPEIPDCVWQQRGHVRGPSEKVEGMEAAEDKSIQRSSRIVDGKCRVYYDPSSLERVGENHSIGMNRRNDIGTRAEILGSTGKGNKPYQRNAPSE